MYCRNCGKEIPENVIFCPECGHKECDGVDSPAVRVDSQMIIQKIHMLFQKVGADNLLKLISLVTAALTLWIRMTSNEIKTVYHFLAQDDYLIMSEAGRSKALAVCVLCGLAAAGVLYFCKKKQIQVNKVSLVLLAGGFLFALLMIFVQLPAPY